MKRYVDKIILFIVSLGPIGYLPAGGTIASLITLGFLYPLHNYSPDLSFCIIGLILLLSVGCIQKALILFNQQDPSQIVLDEVMGMSAAFILSDKDLSSLIISFLLFRILDIFKPSIIGDMEHQPGVLGVAGDDLVAGFLAAGLSRAFNTILYTIGAFL